ncbi:MAG: alpha/beta fold hydrolase, partial [Gammaproteobacteria bacterium]
QMVNDDFDNKTLERGLKILNETDLRAELKNIHCPMQFIFAEYDQLVSSSLTEKLPLYSDRIEISNIKQAGHAVLHFNADAVAIEIERNICKQ